MKKIILLLAFLIPSLKGISQFYIIGSVADSATGLQIPNVRVTLFNNDTTFFREERTLTNGTYLFNNVPANIYSLGAAYVGEDYKQIILNLINDTVLAYQFQLANETQQGQWEIIVQSPEPLGGTDLGILQPDGNIFYCHNTEDPFIFNPQTNDTMSVQGDTTILGCAAVTLLPDGKMIFAGGADQNVYGPGTRKIKRYDYLTGTWQPFPNMLGFRWYPTMERLTDGKLLITGGGTQLNPQRTNSTDRKSTRLNSSHQ